MSENLNFHGNQLIHFQTIFVVGNVLGLLPFAYLFPRVPMHWLVPGLDLGLGIFNLLQYRATGYSELMAYRFLTSIFEVGILASRRRRHCLLHNNNKVRTNNDMTNRLYRLRTFLGCISFLAPGIAAMKSVVVVGSSTLVSPWEHLPRGFFKLPPPSTSLAWTAWQVSGGTSLLPVSSPFP